MMYHVSVSPVEPVKVRISILCIQKLMSCFILFVIGELRTNNFLTISLYICTVYINVFWCMKVSVHIN